LHSSALLFIFSTWREKEERTHARTLAKKNRSTVKFLKEIQLIYYLFPILELERDEK